MKQYKRLIAVLLSGALLIALFAGCAKPQLTKIKLAVDSVPATLLSGIYIAMDTGLYRAAGMEVEIVKANGEAAAEMAAKGEVSFATATQEQLASHWAADSSFPVTAVSAILTSSHLGLLSDKKSGIDSLKKMENKDCSFVGSPASIAVMKAAMRWKDANPDQVDFKDTPAKDAVTALKSTKGVLITRGWENIFTNLNGTQNNFIDFSSQMPSLTFYDPVLVGNNTYLKEQHELARSFMYATSAGYDYAAANFEMAVKIVKKRHPEINATALYNSQKQMSEMYCSPKVKDQKNNPWGFIKKEQWNAYFTFLYKNKIIAKDLKDVGYTNEFLNSVK